MMMLPAGASLRPSTRNSPIWMFSQRVPVLALIDARCRPLLVVARRCRTPRSCAPGSACSWDDRNEAVGVESRPCIRRARSCRTCTGVTSTSTADTLSPGDRRALDGRSHRDAEIGIDLAAGPPVEDLEQPAADQRGAGGAADQQDLLDLRRGQIRPTSSAIWIAPASPR